MHFVIYCDRATQWIWDLYDATGNRLATSVTFYPTEEEATVAVKSMQVNLGEAQIKKEPQYARPHLNDTLLKEIVQAHTKYAIKPLNIPMLAQAHNVSEQVVFDHLLWLHVGRLLSVHPQRVLAGKSYPEQINGDIRSLKFFEFLQTLPPSKIR